MHQAFRVRFGEGLAAVRDEAEAQLYQACPPLSGLFNGLISLLKNGWQQNAHLKIIVCLNKELDVFLFRKIVILYSKKGDLIDVIINILHIYN